MTIREIISRYRYSLALIMAFYLVQVVVSSINPLYMTRLIDELAKQQDAQPLVLVRSVSFLLSASVLRIGIGVFLSRYLGKVALNIAKEIRMQIVRYYLSSPKAQVPDAGDFLTVSSRDVNRLVGFVTGDLNGILVSVTSFIGVSIVLAQMNLALYGLIVAFIPFYFLVYKAFSVMRYRLSLDVREKHAVLLDRMAAATKHQRTIYAHEAQNIIEGLLERRLQECNDAEYRSIINNSWSGLALSTISFLMSATAFTLGTVLVLQGSVTVGMLMAFTTYAGSLLSPVSSLTNMALSWQETKIATAKIARYRRPKEHAGQKINPSPSICAVNFERALFSQGRLNLTYHMELTPLTSIVGLTGVGKSTICECLAGYVSPTAGTVMYKTREGDLIQPPHFRRNVLLVDSHMVLFEDAPILLNLTLGLDTPTSAIDRALEVTDMKQLLRERGLDLSITIREAGFSQGESQRLLITRALLSKPTVLILDEALSGVHPSMCGRILAKISENVPITIIVSHRLSDHERSQIVHCVEAGKILTLSSREWAKLG